MKFEESFRSPLDIRQGTDCHWVSPMILENKLPHEVFAELSNVKKGSNYVDKLVGVFPDQHQIDLNDCPIFTSHCLNLSDVFAEKHGRSPVFTEIRQNIPPSNVYVKDLWINEMYAGSYNKLHRHDGLLSFIIFMDIPYTLEDQLEHENYIDKPEKVLNGCTEFLDPYSQAFHTYNVHKGVEGIMLLFPSWIYHVVYPFKGTDKPRVSLAGNIAFDYRY